MSATSNDPATIDHCGAIDVDQIANRWNVVWSTMQRSAF